MTGFADNPALTVALALAAGVVAQVLARHLRIPGIVLLLGAGVVLGPDVLGVVVPHSLGPALEALTGFAVAVILFEGGLSLDLRRMRGQAPVIRRLLSLGVVVTAGGGAAAAHLLMGWGWMPSLLFGTLVVVTGPTVVTPLLRRIRVHRNLETILESEGVLIDAVGAVVAVVALEAVLRPTGTKFAISAVDAPARLLAGVLLGGAGGAAIALLLGRRRLVPEGYGNILTLTLALALYQVGNALVAESGIMAVVAAGAVVGNARAGAERDARHLREFKEQLTVLFVGMLFVLLAADVRLAQVTALGGPGLLVVGALVFVVRPLNVLLCTWGSDLRWREKAFLSWVAPRGIVAAAVASLFAERLPAGVGADGIQLRALVFLVIAATVVVQGATAGSVARLLKVRRPTARGVAILGAQPLARLLARLMQERGHETTLLDVNPRHCAEAEAEGLKVIYGDAMDEVVLLRSQMDTRHMAIGATNNEAVNLLFAERARDNARVPLIYAVCERSASAVNAVHLKAKDVRMFGGNETDPEMWSVRLRRGLARVEAWRRVDEAGERGVSLPHDVLSLLLPLFRIDRHGRLEPVDENSPAEKGHVLLWLVLAERAEEAGAWLRERGWERAAEADGPAAAAFDGSPRPDAPLRV